MRRSNYKSWGFDVEPLNLSPGYVIHTRPYRESSSLVECFTRDFGRRSLVARGARRPKSRVKSVLQPFQQVLFSSFGKGDLQTLTDIEISDKFQLMSNQHIVSGLYLNELLLKLLPIGDPAPNLYRAYSNCLVKISQQHDLEPVLREFEFELLADIGYAFEFSANRVSDEKNYTYSLEHGVVELVHGHSNTLSFSGQTMLAIANQDWNNSSLNAAKKLTRTIIQQLLGERSIHSRACFIEG